MHGEYDFGTEFKARTIELHVVTPNNLTAVQKLQFQLDIAKYLDPTKGVKTLVFSDDLEKTYYVKYSGKIQPTQYSNFFEFTIPFKMSNPFIVGTDENLIVGSGTIAYAGTFETGLKIEIAGPVTNPSVDIGAETVVYTGTIAPGTTLIMVRLRD